MSDFNPLGNGLFGQPLKRANEGALARDFVMPPFTVLNAREGAWQERKRAWLGLGIKSEVGRAGALMMSNQDGLCDIMKGRPAGRETAPYRKEGEATGFESGTSVFDPVVCELVYRWFSPLGGTVVDPFAGGSVRGIVAAKLGRRYFGCDLRQEQIDANISQRDEICNGDAEGLTWVCGDSLAVVEDVGPPQSDLVFTCPPYGDLERYSDDPRDISTMEYHAFLTTFKKIIFAASSLLKPHAFVVVVVGDFRDNRLSLMRGFVADTIVGFRSLGLWLYNEAILVTAVGSLPVRTGNQFEGSRKLGRTHQHILVFAKGDPDRAAAACNKVIQ